MNEESTERTKYILQAKFQENPQAFTEVLKIVHEFLDISEEVESRRNWTLVGILAMVAIFGAGYLDLIPDEQEFIAFIAIMIAGVMIAFNGIEYLKIQKKLSIVNKEVRKKIVDQRVILKRLRENEVKPVVNLLLEIAEKIDDEQTGYVNTENYLGDDVNTTEFEFNYSRRRGIPQRRKRNQSSGDE